MIFQDPHNISGWWLKNNLEKYDFVNGKDDIPYMKWNIIHSYPFMFQTTMAQAKAHGGSGSLSTHLGARALLWRRSTRWWFPK